MASLTFLGHMIKAVAHELGDRRLTPEQWAKLLADLNGIGDFYAALPEYTKEVQCHDGTGGHAVQGVSRPAG